MNGLHVALVSLLLMGSFLLDFKCEREMSLGMNVDYLRRIFERQMVVETLGSLVTLATKIQMTVVSGTPLAPAAPCLVGRGLCRKPLAGLPMRELGRLKQEAERIDESSLTFAPHVGRQMKERERDVTIACTTKKFYTFDCILPFSMPQAAMMRCLSTASQTT